jgi:hypothetical protein
MSDVLDKTGSTCAATIRYGLNGLVDPRQCKRVARPGAVYCTIHSRLGKRPFVSITDGGWCIFGCGPGRRYESNRDMRVSLALCDDCARAISRATVELDRSRSVLHAEGEPPK